MAWERRWRYGASSSTIRSVLSPVCAVGNAAISLMLRCSFECAAGPGRMHFRAPKCVVVEAHRPTGLLDQLLCDEDAQPHMVPGSFRSLLHIRAAREIGIAQAVQQIRREADPVIADGNANLIGIPGDRNF